jgi:type I restriction enzyme S subunit
LPKRNDIFIVKSGSTTGKIAYVDNNIEFNVWYPLALVRANKEICDSRFLYHVLTSELFQKQVQLSWNFGTQPNIGMGVIENLRVFLPSLKLQRLIAHFLDRKTAAIDTLIAKKQCLIQLLEEKRTALINQAVSKGLNPNAPMKDSGIAWIGEIPKHWDVSPIKYVTTFSSGSTPDKSNPAYWNGSISWITPKDMKRFWIGDSIDCITELSVQETSIKIMSPPMILVVVRGMILAHSFPVAVSTSPLTINQDMKALDCSEKIVAEFLARQLSACKYGVLSFVQEADHGTKALRADLFERLPVLLPPIEEQKEICSYASNQTNCFDKIITCLNGQIEKLQEYRRSLITAAVTGKLEISEGEPDV